jgi:hypothetical protein
MTATQYQSSQSSLTTASQPPAASAPMPWLALGLGVSAVSLCAAAIALFSVTPTMGAADGRSAPFADAFAVPAAQEQVTKLLSGIGGETFAPGACSTATADIVLPHNTMDVAPVAWDRLSAGDCITVTSKSGQAFSFRIDGARPTAQPNAADAPKIELIVTACGTIGEPVAKAVIQPTIPPAPKAPGAARTL